MAARLPSVSQPCVPVRGRAPTCRAVQCVAGLLLELGLLRLAHAARALLRGACKPGRRRRRLRVAAHELGGAAGQLRAGLGALPRVRVRGQLAQRHHRGLRAVRRLLLVHQVLDLRTQNSPVLYWYLRMISCWLSKPRNPELQCLHCSAPP